MPIYEYGCEKCGGKQEVLVRRHSDVPTRCPTCGAGKLKKLFSTFAVSAPDPSAHCQTCPTAADSCSSGHCAGGGCPFSS